MRSLFPIWDFGLKAYSIKLLDDKLSAQKNSRSKRLPRLSLFFCYCLLLVTDPWRLLTPRAGHLKPVYNAIWLAGSLQSLGPAAPTTFAVTRYTTPGVRSLNIVLAAVVWAVCSTVLGAAAVVSRQL